MFGNRLSPASTSRRASRQPRPKRPVSYALKEASGSSARSNARAEGERSRRSAPSSARTRDCRWKSLPYWWTGSCASSCSNNCRRLWNRAVPRPKGYTPHRTAARGLRRDDHATRPLGRQRARPARRARASRDDTIVVFTSDNGATHSPIGGTDVDFFESCGELRGRKGSMYEGGIRVPAIVRWPGRVPAGSESDRVTGFEDWLPTLAELCGAEASRPASTASASRPTLRGEAAASRDRSSTASSPATAVAGGVGRRPQAGAQQLQKGAAKLVSWSLSACVSSSTLPSRWYGPFGLFADPDTTTCLKNVWEGLGVSRTRGIAKCSKVVKAGNSYTSSMAVCGPPHFGVITFAAVFSSIDDSACSKLVFKAAPSPPMLTGNAPRAKLK